MTIRLFLVILLLSDGMTSAMDLFPGVNTHEVLKQSQVRAGSNPILSCLPCKRLSQPDKDPPLTSPPVEETTVTSVEIAPAPHMGLINFLYTMGRIAKARSSAEADTTEDVAKVNPLGMVKSDFFHAVQVSFTGG